MGRARSNRPLNAKQLEAIRLAISGVSWRDISKRIEVSEGTVYSWRTRNVLFQAELTQAQDAMFSETGIKHPEYLNRGMDLLLNQLDSDEVGEELKHQSAVKLIEMVHRNVECIKVVEQNKNSLRKYYEYLKQYFGEMPTDGYDIPEEEKEVYKEKEITNTTEVELNDKGIPNDINTNLSFDRSDKAYE